MQVLAHRCQPDFLYRGNRMLIKLRIKHLSYFIRLDWNRLKYVSLICYSVHICPVRDGGPWVPAGVRLERAEEQGKV